MNTIKLNCSIQFLFVAVFTLLLSSNTYAQKPNNLTAIEENLLKTYNKTQEFYHENNDSLEFYSNNFSGQLKKLVQEDPASLTYIFKKLGEEISISIVTTDDGLFRIYSWDTYTGGTMRNYQSIFQYKVDGKVYTKIFDYGEYDMGTFFTKVYAIPYVGKNTFLAINGGTENTRDMYETARGFSISGTQLSDSVKVFKTNSGPQNSIMFEYNFFSVYERPERPIILTKYNPSTRSVYIPIVYKDGTVTDKYLLYRFTGRYFEKVKTGVRYLIK